MTAAWPEVTLGEVCEFRYGKALPAHDRVGGDFGVFGSNGQVGRHDKPLTAGSTIIVGRKGSFGEVTYSEDACWPIDTTYFVDATATEADLRWLYYRLKALPLTSLNRAAAVPGLNRADAYSLRLLLPPLQEQRRIASLLDAADCIAHSRREALTSLDHLISAVSGRWFDEPAPVVPLGDHVRFLTSGARGWAKYYAERGARFVRSLDVRMNEIASTDAVYVDAPNSAEARRIRIEAGDVLLTITGSRIGRAAEAPCDLAGAYISQHVAIIRADENRLLPGYLALWLTHPAHGQRQIAARQYGQTKPGLNFDQIRSFQLPVPELSRQQALLRFVDAARDARSLARQGAKDIALLFDTLRHRAFRRSV